MRARILAPLAVLLGGAVAVLLTRQLLRRRRNLRAAQLRAIEPLEAILVYDDSIDVDMLADLGDLTGQDSGALHTIPRAQQGVHLDDDRAQALGENMFEALEEEAIENGLEPEASLFLDETDDFDPSTDVRDRPVADFGSGGPRGL